MPWPGFGMSLSAHQDVWPPPGLASRLSTSSLLLRWPKALPRSMALVPQAWPTVHVTLPSCFHRLVHCSWLAATVMAGNFHLVSHGLWLFCPCQLSFGLSLTSMQLRNQRRLLHVLGWIWVLLSLALCPWGKWISLSVAPFPQPWNETAGPKP